MTLLEIQGRVRKFGDNIDTDAMFPGHALGMSIERASMYAFDGVERGWAESVQAGDIVVAGRNTGIGSSRPVPVLLRRLGISAVVADEFNSLFFRNCINYGIPAIAASGVSAMFEEGDTLRIDFLQAEILNCASGDRICWPKFPQLVTRILECGGLLAQLEGDGLVVSNE